MTSHNDLFVVKNSFMRKLQRSTSQRFSLAALVRISKAEEIRAAVLA
jgi:hypothetical protein